MAALDHSMMAMAVGGRDCEDCKHGGGGVACVVQPGLTYTGHTEQRFPLVVVGVRIERAAVRLGEYPSFVVPELASGRALGFLLCPVLESPCAPSPMGRQ